MLSLETFLDNYTNSFFIIRDGKGKILYPHSKEKLDLFKKVLESYTDDNGYYIVGNQYFEYDTQVLIDNNKLYVVESLKNITRYEEESILAKTDFVTNLGDKRLTYETFNNFILNSIELGYPFACAMGDADLFKSVNDTYGHVCGDYMLKSLGEYLFKNTRHKYLSGKHVCRGVDIVGRIGGEEFLIVLNNVSMLTAWNIINKIRKEIELSHILYEDKNIPSCTMSFGMHYVDKNELMKYKLEDTTIDEIRDSIIKKCDQALYVSKVNGRNQINVFGINSTEKLGELMYSKRK